VNILTQIVDRKKHELTETKRRLPLAEIKARISAQPTSARDFAAALRTPRRGDIAVIAEIKAASPSAGTLVENPDPVAIAADYAAGPADAISVLTERRFFRGDPAYLQAVRTSVDLPLLRKDFLFEPYQIYESQYLGADAVLLIAAILAPAQLQELHALATERGLDALVEVHDEAELDATLRADAHIIGINTRRLSDFHEDLGTFARLAGGIPGDRLRVAESAIRTRADVETVRDAGAHAVLVGTTLMRSADPARTIRQLKGLS
jgi:indole-3-glycerol phosphate synthase